MGDVVKIKRPGAMTILNLAQTDACDAGPTGLIAMAPWHQHSAPYPGHRKSTYDCLNLGLCFI